MNSSSELPWWKQPLRRRVIGLPRDLRLEVVRAPRRRASWVPLRAWISTKGRMGVGVP
jgi:hypothetical protein